VPTIGSGDTAADGAGTTAAGPVTSICVAENWLPSGMSQTFVGAPMYPSRLQKGTLVEFTNTAV